MELILVKDYDEMSQVAFDFIKEVIEEKADATISMTTGGTPRGLFKLMVDAIQKDTLDISKTTFLNLDEYIGPKNDPYTVYRFMHDNLYNLIDKKPETIFLIDGEGEDVDAELKRYGQILANHPRDVQILGLGTNGHIGANEPGTPFDSTLFLADHTESTIQSTMAGFNITREQAPTQMITLGFCEILEAEHVILMVSGVSKAEALKHVLEGEISEAWPASYLKNKENVIIIADEAAASKLNLK